MPDAAGEVAFEAADGFATRVAFGLFADEVGGGVRVLEEDLLSAGYTLDHALREPSDGVVWVPWDGPKGIRVRFDR